MPDSDVSRGGLDISPEKSMTVARKLGFIQPFGFSSAGGGSKILRAIAHDGPIETLSIVTSPPPPVATTVLPEIHLPARPYLGRIERTRFYPWFNSLSPLFASRFRTRLRKLVLSQGVTALHIITHSPDCMDAVQVARELNLPYFLCVHDDLAYAMAGQPGVSEALAKLAVAWGEAAGRFVISAEMGEEYCRRYGRQSYHIVSDGLETIASTPRQLQPGSLRVYFMGLFHHSYTDNLKSLITALDAVAAQRPGADISLTLRCGGLPASITPPQHVRFTVLPFGAESEVAADLLSADLLYMPLPFSREHQGLTRYSLSTKMITYLGSGIPILYHGPIAECAAGTLLQTHAAAICLDSLDPIEIQTSIDAVPERYSVVTQAALALANSDFRLADMRRRFWDTILERTSV
jgi:hypothetical protein